MFPDDYTGREPSSAGSPCRKQVRGLKSDHGSFPDPADRKRPSCHPVAPADRSSRPSQYRAGMGRIIMEVEGTGISFVKFVLGCRKAAVVFLPLWGGSKGGGCGEHRACGHPHPSSATDLRSELRYPCHSSVALMAFSAQTAPLARFAG